MSAVNPQADIDAIEARKEPTEMNTPPTTISDEAVEAAARAIYDSCWEDSTPDTLAAWELISEQERREFIEQARAAVAAVVPYIEAGLRAKISDEILTAASKTPCVAANGRTYWTHSLETRLAARVARGTQGATK